MTEQPTADRAALWAALMKEAEADPKGGHLIWRGSMGAGIPMMNAPGRGRVQASRIAIECTTGEPVPRGVHVVPACGFFFCLAPDHLKVGRQPKGGRRAAGRQAA